MCNALCFPCDWRDAAVTRDWKKMNASWRSASPSECLQQTRQTARERYKLCGNGYSCYGMSRPSRFRGEVKEYRDMSRRREWTLRCEIEMIWLCATWNGAIKHGQCKKMVWFLKKEAAVTGNAVIMRCYTESLGNSCDCHSWFPWERSYFLCCIPSPWGLFRMERKTERGQRRRKRHNSELKRQPVISNVETVAVCSTPKYAGEAASQQMPGTNTGMGMAPGTQRALPAPEGKMIPALKGKQDLSLIKACVSIRLPHSKLSYT